jgi:GNAT superfamily N-acetyltransferase
MVHNLIVARRMRNAGIGSTLMADAESWARRRRARRVQLEVLARNHEAVSFCDELGFETLSASLEKRI